jgi:uncharacterized protein (UPF0332 family)
MKGEITALFEKAAESLDAAEALLERGYPGFSASRAYYGMFYAAEALLLEKGLTFSKHSAVIAAFGEHFAKTNKMDQKYHRYLIEGYEQRQIGDYEALEKITPSAAMALIERGREFVAAAKLEAESKE